MRTFDAVIFDLDGTLLDTIDDIADSMNHALTLFGFRAHPVEAYKRFVGNGVDVLVENVLATTGATEKAKQAVKSMYRKTYARWSQRKTRPYAGMPETLARLASAGVRLAVLSNKPDADTAAVVAHFFPDVGFACVTGQKDGVPVKPDPTGANATIAVLGVDRTKILYVGDTATDMATAHNARLFAAGVLWGFRDRAELEGAGAAVVLAHPDELVDLVLGEVQA